MWLKLYDDIRNFYIRFAVMTDMVGERLRLIAAGWSRRHEEALAQLDEAEREKRLAWEAYDEHERQRLTSKTSAQS